jgi:hypothetical protein
MQWVPDVRNAVGEATDEESLEKREEEFIIVRNSSVLWAVHARSGTVIIWIGIVVC